MIKSLIQDRRILWILVGILFLAAFLRLFMLGNNPFVADEFLDVNATYGHNQMGVWQAWDFNTGAPSVRQNQASDERAWLYRIQVSELFNISFFPPEEWAARLVSALWGVLTTVVIFGVTASLTRNVWIALIAAALWAVSVPAIEQNRQIRMYSMFAPVFVLLSWSLYQFLEGSKRQSRSLWGAAVNFNYLYLIAVVALFLLSLHLHLLTLNIFFVLFAYVCFMAGNMRKHQGKLWNRYAVYALVGSAVLTLGIVYASSQDSLSQLFKLGDNVGYLNHILATYWHPLIGALIIGYGMYVSSFSRRASSGRVWISANFLIILLLAMFLWNRNVGSQYIFFIQPFAMMLAALGIYHLSEMVLARTKDVTTRKKWILLVGAFVLLVPHYAYFMQENNTYNLTSDADTPNYRRVFDYVKDEVRDGDVMITRNFRNFYYNDLGIRVFDFGSERTDDLLAAEGKVAKITLPILLEIIQNNPSGWVVYSDNDEAFISTEAREYMQANLDRVTDSPRVRGAIFVYRWGRD